MNLEELGQEVR
jgi:hypothetical protein